MAGMRVIAIVCVLLGMVCAGASAQHVRAVIELDRHEYSLLDPITGSVLYTNDSKSRVTMLKKVSLDFINVETGDAAPSFLGPNHRMHIELAPVIQEMTLEPGDATRLDFTIDTDFVRKDGIRYVRLMPGDWDVRVTPSPSRREPLQMTSTTERISVKPGDVDLLFSIQQIDGRFNALAYPHDHLAWHSDLSSVDEVLSLTGLISGLSESAFGSRASLATRIDDQWTFKIERHLGKRCFHLIELGPGGAVAEFPFREMGFIEETRQADWVLKDTPAGTHAVLLGLGGVLVKCDIEQETATPIGTLGNPPEISIKFFSAVLAADGSRAYVVQDGQVMAYGIDGSQRVITRGDLQDRIHHHLRGCAGTTSEPRAAFYYEPETAELRTLPGPWAPVAIDEDAGVIAFEHAETHEVTVRSLETFDELFSVALERAGEQYVLLPRPTRLVVAFASETTPGFLDEVVLVCDGVTEERLDLGVGAR